MSHKLIRIAIHPDSVGDDSNSKNWTEALVARGVQVQAVNLLTDVGFTAASHSDAVLWRFAHSPTQKQAAHNILTTLEQVYGLAVMPTQAERWHYDEKAAQYYLLKALSAPTPQTWLFWSWQDAIDWLPSAPFPLVFKLSPGASSSNVHLVHTPTEARRWIDCMFFRGVFPQIWLGQAGEHSPARDRLLAFARRVKDSVNYTVNGEYPRLPDYFWKPEAEYVYFQEYLPNEYDTRVVVVGEHAAGFRRMNRLGDFRASGGGRNLFDPELIDQRCIEIAFDISRRGKFTNMAYDFIYKGDQPVISEITWAYGPSRIQECPGWWREDFTWEPGQKWPEEYQIEQLLKILNKSG